MRISCILKISDSVCMCWVWSFYLYGVCCFISVISIFIWRRVCVWLLSCINLNNLFVQHLFLIALVFSWLFAEYVILVSVSDIMLSITYMCWIFYPKLPIIIFPSITLWYSLILVAYTLFFYVDMFLFHIKTISIRTTSVITISREGHHVS